MYFLTKSKPSINIPIKNKLPSQRFKLVYFENSVMLVSYDLDKPYESGVDDYKSKWLHFIKHPIGYEPQIVEVQDEHLTIEMKKIRYTSTKLVTCPYCGFQRYE